MRWSDLIGAKIHHVLAVPCDDAELTAEERAKYSGYFRPFLGLEGDAVEVSEFQTDVPHSLPLAELLGNPAVQQLAHEAVGRTIERIALHRDWGPQLWILLSGDRFLWLEDGEDGTTLECVDMIAWEETHPGFRAGLEDVT